MNLPGYSPDFNAYEAVWGWAREEATGNLCLGTKALTGESRKLPPRAVQQEGGGQAPLPHRPAIKGRRATAGLPAPFPTHGKCTSHLGFSLDLQGFLVVAICLPSLLVVSLSNHQRTAL